MSLCQHDSDCPGALVCYANVSWYTVPPGENGCICSPYYGFSGPTCENILETTTSQFWIGTGAVIIFLQVGLFLASMYQMGRLWMNNIRGFSAEVVGIAQVWLGSVFTIISQAGFIWASQTPSEAAYIPGSSTNDKQNRLHSVWMAMYALASIFQIVAAVTIALLWIDISMKVSRMTHAPKGGNLATYQWRFAVFEVLFIIAFIVPIAIGLQVITVAMAYVLEILVVVLYIAGQRMMIRVIRSVSNSTSGDAASSNKNLTNKVESAPESPSHGGTSPVLGRGDSVKPAQPSSKSTYSKVLREMQQTTIAICLCVGMAAVSSTIMFATMIVGWKEVTWLSPGSSLQIIVFFTMALSVTIGAMWVTLFLKRCADRLIRKESKANQQLVPLSDSHDHKVATQSS